MLYVRSDTVSLPSAFLHSVAKSRNSIPSKLLHVSASGEVKMILALLSCGSSNIFLTTVLNVWQPFRADWELYFPSLILPRLYVYHFYFASILCSRKEISSRFHLNWLHMEHAFHPSRVVKSIRTEENYSYIIDKYCLVITHPWPTMYACFYTPQQNRCLRVNASQLS
jgi:hypothetical protein